MRGIVETNVDKAGGTIRPLQSWVKIAHNPV